MQLHNQLKAAALYLEPFPGMDLAKKRYFDVLSFLLFAPEASNKASYT